MYLWDLAKTMWYNYAVKINFKLKKQVLPDSMSKNRYNNVWNLKKSCLLVWKLKFLLEKLLRALTPVGSSSSSKSKLITS